ncbi:MAG: DUF4269 domain-containing protein [Flavobacterium sp.]|nr:MAG: DUF4269 domain-containing protein [Flavobacterium sp.]
MDFLNIDYLKFGNQKQIQAFEVLTKNNILSRISEFNPILVGTIPINIAIENSDLDIICNWKDKKEFMDKLQFHFENENQFSIREALIDGITTVVANFISDGFEIEIFGQDIPVENQNGYMHMLIEHEILNAKGEDFRLEIIKLKQNGYKTEPAFAELLGLRGNPYKELLKYKL